MIVTYNWLKEFVDFDYSPQDLADRLTMVGLEVEGITFIGDGFDTVIVARLEKVEPHPNADRLTVCQVNNGHGVVQVVCGATNHKTGDTIALAQPGSVLPGDFKIKKSKIRGQESVGMLCSEKELGLSSEAAGIMILDSALEIGTPVFDALKLKDAVLEIGLTPNRPDCLSVVGIAREVAAMCGKPLTLPLSTLVARGVDITKSAGVVIDDSQGCPRYAARMIRDVKIGPSPDWMVQRLESIGLRSINNVVDVTNYVMMELGHPMHAFDFRDLVQGEIIVKRATEKEPFTTLDDAKHQLSSEDLMICDGERPVALAGVMGGLNSEVREDTSIILLEAAYFNPTIIRRTSKRHGLHTESSHRFERGADIDMIPVVLDRAAALIADLAGGEIAAGLIDVYPVLLPKVEITLSAANTAKILGIHIDLQQIIRLLKGIGLDVVSDKIDTDGTIVVGVPSFRPDLGREIDLIEEVARLYGYDNLPITMPRACFESQLEKPELKLEAKVRNLLVGSGFSEIINYSFFAPSAARKLHLAADDQRLESVRILNPLNEDQAVMRTTLVPSMLDTLARNLSHRSTDLHLFELRPVFFASGDENGSRQELHLAAAISGQKAPLSWNHTKEPVDFYDMKGVLEKILTLLCVKDPCFDSENSETYLHPGKSAKICSGKTILGYIGEVHPQVLQEFDLGQEVYLLELNLDKVFEMAGNYAAFTVPSKFPAVERDSSLLIKESVEAQKVLAVAQKSLGKLGQNIVIFDVYKGKGVPAGKKSIALRVRYSSPDKTLTEDEVAKAHGKLIKSVCHQLEAEIR